MFKDKFGHCDVPSDYRGGPSLVGAWCNSIRTAYNSMQLGLNTNLNLDQIRLDQLDNIGFQWVVSHHTEESKEH